MVNLTPKKLFEKIKYILSLERQKLRSISFDEKEANKCERFVQTYLILFGLLLSYNQISMLQNVAMAFFILFLFGILIYYSILTSRRLMYTLIKAYGTRLFICLVNFMAFVSSFIFCYVLMLFFITIGNGQGISSGVPSILLNKFVFYPLIFIMSLYFGTPLFINHDMIIISDVKNEFLDKKI